MDKIYYPYPATNKRYKFFIITDIGRKISFGSAKNKDYTIYYKEQGKEIADKKRKAYIARHSKLNEKWDDFNSAGAWSARFLWSYPTKEEAYKNIKKELLKKKLITKEQYNEYIF